MLWELYVLLQFSKDSKEDTSLHEWLAETSHSRKLFFEDTAFGEELMEKLNKAGYTNFSKFFQGDEDWNLNQLTGNLIISYPVKGF